MGRSTKTAKSPWDISMARRKFSSTIGPNTKPSTTGATERQVERHRPDDAERGHLAHVEQAVLGAVDADADEKDRRRKRWRYGT